MKLIEYLPPRLAEIKEIADIQNAVEPVLKEIDDAIDKVLKNKVPLYADREGIEKWEEWLNINPPPDLSLEERRRNIIAQLNARLPYTDPQLHKMLKGLVGEQYRLKEEKGFVYDIDVNAKTGAYDAVLKLLERTMPAHVLWKLRTYLDIKQTIYTGGYLQTGITVHITGSAETESELKVGATPVTHFELGGIVKIKD